MKKLPRDPIRFDVFDAFATYSKDQKVSLHDKAVADSFVSEIRASVDRSLANPSLLYGRRTEAMFEALVVALGNVRIIKQEDAGDVYTSIDNLQLPDFRLVLLDDAHLLVEVKNFYSKDPLDPFRMKQEYLEGLKAFARVMGCELKLAIFWVAINRWTLLSPTAFKSERNEATITPLEALPEDELSLLGDVHIATRFPLRMILRADTGQPQPVDQEGDASILVSGVELYCAGRLITEPLEQSIAHFLMLYGKWEYVGPTLARNADGLVEAIEHEWVPHGESGHEFAIIGSLSEMFSAFYRHRTSEEDQVDQLLVDVTPAQLGELIPKDYKGTDLPLWRFVLKARGSSDSE
jgi:hypothetical protein